MLELKPIATASIARALEKAERYRLLNEPRQAESICLDVLGIDPENAQALSCLLLSLTDQFSATGSRLVDRAKELLPRLPVAYERVYYAGIISERCAKCRLQSGHPGARFAAYEYLIEAIKHYGEAELLAPIGNDDATLRHNACVRMIERDRLEAPSQDDGELPLE